MNYIDNIQHLLNNIKLTDKDDIRQEIKNIFDKKLRNKSFKEFKKHFGSEGN